MTHGFARTSRTGWNNSTGANTSRTKRWERVSNGCFVRKMQVRWSPQAAEDLAAIVAHIPKDDPAAAQRTAREIYERAGALKTFPHRGRQGRVKGTRELPLPPLPADRKRG